MDINQTNELYLGISCELLKPIPPQDLFKIPFQLLRFAFDTVIREESTPIVKRIRYISLSNGATTLWENGQLSMDNRDLGTINIQNCYGLPPQPSKILLVLQTFYTNFRLCLKNCFLMFTILVQRE